MAAVVVVSTFPNEDVAASVARALVTKRLVACVNLVRDVRSIYRWGAKIEDSPEVLAIMKTTDARVAALRGRLKALHPYDVPEIIELPVAGGHAPYLEWIATATGSRSGKSRSTRPGRK